jgi:ABC-type antimicrobial peptide transport system permease subunit
MSRQYWPEADAVGKQFSWITPTGIRAVTIVGVVSDLRQEGLAAASGPSFYIPLAQSPSPVRNLVVGVRSALPLAAVASEIRGAVQKNDRALPVFARQPATELIRRSTGAERFNMFVVAMFAAGALVLAVSGLYAVISYLVIHSTHEFGIRIALGATPGRILAMVMVRGFGYIATGLTVGIAAALSLVQFMRTLLFGIGGADASTFCVVTMLLTGVAFLSILIPAIRATKVDPIASLRR